jgi:O-antigen/teichoic acid export membrane protein
MLLLSNFGQVGLRLLLSLLIARLAGPERMGVYVALTALTFIIARIADAGLPNAILYFARARKAAVRKCLWVSSVHGAVMLPLVTILVLVSDRLGLANSESSVIIAEAWPILVVLGTVQLSGALITQLLIPLESYKAYGIAVTLSPLVSIAICGLHGHDLTISKILTAVLTGESSAALVAFAMVVRATRGAQEAGPSPGVGAIYSYAIKSYFGTSMKAIGQRADRLILSLLVPNSALAAYAIAMSLRDSALLPFNSHSMVLRNRLIDREAHAGLIAARALLRIELIRWTVVAAVLAGTLMTAAPFVVPILYGAEYHPAIGVLIIIGATLPALGVATFCWTALLSSARPTTVSLGLVVTGLVNLAALYVGARTGGVLGASIGALIASLLAAAWWLLAAFRS